MIGAKRVALLVPSYTLAAKAIFAAATTQPTSTRKKLINSTIVALQSAGVWSLIDVLYVTAAADNQIACLNWKNPGTFTGIEVNSPTFQIDRGYTGNGTTSRVRTQYTPSTNAINYAKDNASAWVWSLTDAQGNVSEIGSVTAPRTFIQSRNGGDNIVVGLNDATASTTPNAASIGLFGVSRPAVNIKRAWKNGVQLGTDFAIASTAVSNQEQWICGGDATNFSTKQIAAAVWGASLNGNELPLYNALLRYMQGVGAA